MKVKVFHNLKINKIKIQQQKHNNLKKIQMINNKFKYLKKIRKNNHN